MNTFSRKTVIRAHREPMCFGEIHLFQYIVTAVDGVQRVEIVSGVRVDEIKNEGVMPPAPTMRLRPEDAQLFMDELWSVGIRPTEGTGSAGSLAATQAHLRDMRAIVGKKLDVELK
jgi:hypothetical protein